VPRRLPGSLPAPARGALLPPLPRRLGPREGAGRRRGVGPHGRGLAEGRGASRSPERRDLRAAAGPKLGTGAARRWGGGGLRYPDFALKAMDIKGKSSLSCGNLNICALSLSLKGEKMGIST